MIDRNIIKEKFMALQDHICSGLESLDGQGQFRQEIWKRDGGGGGKTRVINSRHIEKGGVNFSAVEGEMPSNIANALGLGANRFFATGVSIVLHAENPLVPIIHMNVRYFETDSGVWWFGGGIDLTPHFIVDSDAIQFHRRLKQVCDKHDSTFYREFKTWADDYFYVKHRKETRGIGGIFYDRLSESRGTKEQLLEFSLDVGHAFVPAYSDVFMQYYEMPYTDREKEWQLHRRGRYAEFNLVLDKGTKFGLDTDGNIESILMSLPPECKWTYKFVPNKREQITLDLLKKEIDWINHK